VLLAALAVYVASGASWHTVIGPAENIVGEVEGLTVTTLSALVVPHKPVAVAVIVAVPLNPASQFITPVVELMEPAAVGETE
jgi:hypothetical protein